MGDYEEASEALTELRFTNSVKAKELCLKILAEKLGDKYVQAGAFEALYAIDRLAGFEFIRKNLDLV